MSMVYEWDAARARRVQWMKRAAGLALFALIISLLAFLATAFGLLN
jgi:hypothetical protein